MNKKVTPLPLKKASLEELAIIDELAIEPGVAVEVDQTTAEDLGAFEEGALTVDEAIDSVLDEIGRDE